MRIALGLEYHGTPFHGWQSQADGSGVQNALERALSEIAGERIAVIAAGRTDTGAHATLQVAHFDTGVRRPETAWVRGVNALLPDAIAVQWALPVAEEFHARFSATGRHYTYLLLARPVRPAMLNGRAGWYHQPLALARMREGAAALIGRHDFSTFRAAECQANSPVRTLDRLDVIRIDDLVEVHASARSFLHHQVRSMVGSLEHVGAGKWGAAALDAALAACDRARCGMVAPARGLFLMRVDY